MNNRIQKIISLLLKEPNITITEMMQKLSLTRRQINYAINLIDEKLKNKNLPIIKRHRDGSFSFSPTIKEILPLYNNQGMENTYTDSDRQALILIYLIFNKSYVSLNHFTTFLNYSKTTISYDLKEINQITSNYNLKVVYNRVEGFSLVGSEENVLRLATDLILGHINLLTDKIVNKLNPSLSIKKQSTILIMDIENRFKATFSDKYFDAIKILIEAILIRNLNSKTDDQKPDPFITQTYEYQYLKNHPLLKNVTDEYIKWIALEILSSNLYDKSNLNYGQDEVQILKFVHQIVEGFKAKTLVRIEDQDQFEQRLLNHLRPACFRVKYNLSGLGSIGNIQQDNHEILMKIVTELVQPLELWLGTKFPLNEVRLLTYYFGYQLVGNFEAHENNAPKYKAVVVCSNGIIMSKILIKELRSLFPEMKFLFTMSAREFEESNEKFDVVFTTIPLQTKLPQYMVTANMNYARKIGLRYQVLNSLGLEKTDAQVKQILNLISKYAKVKDSNQLKTEIKRILVTSKLKIDNYDKKKDLPDLLAYVKPQYIQVIDQEIDWHVALQTALQPLIDDQVVEERYYRELVKQIDSIYNYSFLGRYISIPHSSPSYGIKADGISLLISKQPIILPNNKTVRVIAPIAFFNMDRFLKAINQFASLAIDSNTIQQLIDSSTSKEAYQVIKKYVKKRG